MTGDGVREGATLYVMALRSYAYNIGDLRNADWSKSTLDLPATNVDELRIYLDSVCISVEDFKALPAYGLALASGEYPWLAAL